MRDLCDSVGNRMHIALDGREIDMGQNVKPSLPHMLGITAIGRVHDPTKEEGTLLDPSIEFWQEYNNGRDEQDIVETKRQVREKIETAIRLLQEENVVNMKMPYGENSDLVYVSVDDEMKKSHSPKRDTECIECGSRAHCVESIETDERSGYKEVITVVCTDCEFEQAYELNLTQW